MTKPFSISKELVWAAYKQVKSNGGSAGIDQESIDQFELNLKDNLYKIWNRMASGSYFPPPVKAVLIPKKSSGTRTLGVPTVSDRIAQTVVKSVLEPALEKVFHKDSYGYRPGKSAHEAIAVTRQRCWQYPWVVEFDIKGLFDNIDHDLLMKALRKHCSTDWILLYVERWLKASMEMPGGALQKRGKGTPQGGVISPILANLFLHYAFDKWAVKALSGIPFCRYADDGLLHCVSLLQAEKILSMLKARFKEVGLEIHTDKSHIVYCKHAKRQLKFNKTSFTFLGYDFCPRQSKNGAGEKYLNFSAGASKIAIKNMKAQIRSWRLPLRNEWNIHQIANYINPVLRGWYQYYGKFYKTALKWVWRNLNEYLCRWVMQKYKRYKRHKTKASSYLARIAIANRGLFVHWKLG
ncbi:MAG: group II intron reverse transcriptase/maturase, partial [Candidatus Cardinium sp.]|nr:group II intron reverse transcriptase/maturase [Candidatus Cardinium sp.]